MSDHDEPTNGVTADPKTEPALEAATSGAVDNVVRVDFAARARKPAPPPPAKTPGGVPLPPSSADLGPDRPEKLRQFARMVERGMVMVTLDARPRALARVPVKFQGELQLNLNFSHRFGLADFGYDDDGVRASLSFGGVPFFCDIPWTAVYGMTSHVDDERLLWPDSFPQELLDLLPAQARHAPRPDLHPEPRAEELTPEASSTSPGDGPSDDDPPPNPPFLRRIK